MSRFGWAYVNSEFTGAVANGPDKSIQFASGSSQKISGSSNLTFDYNTNTLYLTGALLMSGTSGQAYISEVDYIDFDVSASIPSYKLGRMYYDTNTTDLAYYLTYANQSLQIGQQTVVKVKNSTGSPIAKGKIVHIIGGVGDNPLIATASWENDNNSANTLGMLMSTVANGGFGYALLNGVLTGVNTDPAIYSEGQIVYLSSSGDYTNITPTAPNHTVRLGQVIRAHAVVGSVFIKIDNGYEIDELHNVLITSASTGDLLTYNSSSTLWTNTKTLSGSYILSGSLSITGNTTNNTLQISNVGVVYPSSTRNSNFNVNAQDYIIYASGSALTGTLSPSLNGRVVMIYNYGSTNIFLTGSGITGFVAPNGADVLTLNITLNPRVIQLLYFTTTNRWITI